MGAEGARGAGEVSIAEEAAVAVLEGQPAEDATAVSAGEGSAGDGTRSVPTTAAEEEHRRAAVERIRASSAPAALKERLAAVAESANDAASVEACLKAVEETLPEFLKGEVGKAARREHPAGEVFFRGNRGELTDEQAEEIARGQLTRSGLLRGQRVRVAE
jgi:hypothetical protein